MTKKVLHLCPDCKCQFVQPFKCTTCGAEKLYDATVRGQAETIQLLTQRLQRINAINDNPAIYNDEINQLSTVQS